MARDDAIAFIGAILLIAGIAVQFGPGWALITAGAIFIYVGMRLEVDHEPDKTTDTPGA